MLSEIPAVAASLRSFAELTSLIMKAKVDVAVKDKAAELNSVIISVQASLLAMQSEYQTLLQAKDELEKRLVAMENWKADAANYELKEISPGTFVYTFKPKEPSTAPSHWLCANCYNNNRQVDNSKGIYHDARWLEARMPYVRQGGLHSEVSSS